MIQTKPRHGMYLCNLRIEVYTYDEYCRQFDGPINWQETNVAHKIIFPTPDLVNTWNYLRQQGAQ